MFGKQPESRPCALGAKEAGPDFQSSVHEGLFALGIEAAGEIGCRVVGLPLILYATQYQVAFADIIERVQIGHVVVPVGFAAWNLAPHSCVKLPLLSEFLLPSQSPSRLLGGAGVQQAEEDKKSPYSMPRHIILV